MTSIGTKEELKEGDRVKVIKGSREGMLGTVKSIPNDAVAWVHIDNDEVNRECGITLTYLEKMVQVKLEGSIKKDEGKPDYTMLTLEMIDLVSKVRMFGAKKYARGNFKKTGFKYTRSLAAALRHIYAFLNGEDNDPESGLSHLGHAICCIEHLIYDTKHHPSNDDRKD